MENFTPIDLKKLEKKSGKFFLIANILLMFLVVGITGYYLKNKLITKKEKAVGISCKTITNRNDCNAACSPVKPDGKQYSCKWLSEEQKCIESSKECGRDGATGSCPPGTTESGVFDHCNNCLALCDCKVDGQNNGTYFCPQFNNLCPTYYPNQCNVNSQTPTPTPTKIITNTPTPTLTPTPTDTPYPTSTVIPTLTSPPNQPTNTPTPTEIIVVRSTNTPIIDSPTNTPIQQIPQTGNIRSSWVFVVPIGIILLGLLL